MAYREAASPAEETLEVFEVRTAKGATATGVLLGTAIVFGVAYGVSLFAGAPPAIEPYVWTFALVAVASALPALWLWRRRRRQLRLVRAGTTVKLVVPREVEVTFPLALSGTQVTVTMRGVPVHHVYLKLVDARGRAILFEEVRGAIHGALSDWFATIDPAPAAAYEVGHKGQAAILRARVEEVNAKDADVT
jgi:hypothetical protein